MGGVAGAAGVEVVRAAVVGRIPDIGAARMIWRPCPPVLSRRRASHRFNTVSKCIVIHEERE